MQSIEFIEEIYETSATHYIPVMKTFKTPNNEPDLHLDKLSSTTIGEYGYELLGEYTKLFFDIDGSGKALMDKTDEFKQHLDYLLETGERKFIYCYSLPEDMEEMSRRVDRRKLSFHIIFEDKKIKRIGFKPAYEEDTLKWLLGKFYDELRPCVDKGVYDINRKLRLPCFFDDDKPVALQPCEPTINLTRFAVNLSPGIYKIMVPKVEVEEKKMDAPKKPLTDDQRKEMITKLEMVNPARFVEYNEWKKLLNVCNSNDLPLELFQKISKASGYSKYKNDDCARAWYTFKCPEDKQCRFPTINTWLKEDGIDVDAMFCEKKKGMISDLLKAYGQFGTLTDMSVAEIFFNYYKDSLYYTQSGWIHYNENRGWEMGDDDAIVYPLMKLIGEGMNRHVITMKPKEDDDEKQKMALDIKRKALIKETVNLCSHNKCAKIVKTARVLFKNDKIIEEFDAHPYWFCFSDFKAINMQTGETIQITKEDKIITTCGYPLPPRIETNVKEAEKFINTLVEKESYDSYMSMLACNFSGNPNKNQKVYIHTGTGGNGKSLIGLLLNNTLKNYAAVLPIEQLTKDSKGRDDANSSLAAMRGKRYAQFNEPEDCKDTTLKIARVKELSGEDKIKVREVYGKSFDMTISFSMNIFCNEKPKMSKSDGGIERRLAVFPYVYSFVDEPDKDDPYQKEKDDTLEEKMKRNTAFQNGFLYLCLDAWKKNNGRFICGDHVKAANKEYIMQQNPLASWIEDKYVPSAVNEDKEKEKFIRAPELHKLYQKYSGNVLSATSFNRFLSQLGLKIQEDKSNGKKVFIEEKM